MQDGEENTWVNADNCIGRGGCYSVCPAEGAIEIEVVSESKPCEPMVQHYLKLRCLTNIELTFTFGSSCISFRISHTHSIRSSSCHGAQSVWLCNPN